MGQSLLQLIEACRGNDRKAQSALYERSFAPLMRICQRYRANREDAVALLNEGFLKILLALNQYDAQQSWEAWINTIMIRTAIDAHRREHQRQRQTDYCEHEYELERAQLNQQQLAVIDQLNSDEVRKLIFSLPYPEHLVFSLYEWEGYSHREIAAELQVSERSSKRYLARAKALLRAKIDRMGNLKKVM